jgi:uncharacterized protein YukE
MATPGRVEIDTGALSAFTGDVTTAGNGVAQAVDNLSASVRKARDGWQGASNDEFDAACTKILALLTKGRENLVQLGVTNLTQHVEDSNKAETDMTSAMADLAGQLRMPL